MPAYRTKSTPKTYIIDYFEHVHDADKIVAQLREAPPNVFHSGHDYTYDPAVGATHYYGRIAPSPAPWSTHLNREQAQARSKLVRRWTNLAHEAGVEVLIPYVCNQRVAGDPVARKGIWWFYDHWDQFADVVGPKPAADPIDWLQREPDGKRHHNYPYRHPGTEPPFEFAPCPSNPHWIAWISRTARLIAKEGYDGVFIDNNIMHCYCKHCHKAFQTYLSETYSAAQLRRRFGTDNVSALRLSTLGDKVLWAQAQPGYLRRIKEREPEDFRRLFGTDDLDAAVVSEAGNGFHWGRAHTLWLDHLRAQHTEGQVERILREGDVSSLGISTAKDLCLWADTQKYWAWAVARLNARIRDGGRQACPEFITVPNWGTFSGFRNVDSRRLEAKNVRLWKPGTDVIFFEEDYYPSTIAPGYTFDLIMGYKYAGACGMRVCAVPYRGMEYRSLCELATAEAAAWSGDGMFVQPNQPVYLFPEVRRHYRAFYERHADWYVRRTSTAEVGLVYSFDELHLENTHHMHEVYPLAKYLADHHVLFDLLCEGQIRLPELRRFSLVILPHVQYLPVAARRALLRYVREGGCVLVTGNTGAYDEHARPNERQDALAALRATAWPEAYRERRLGKGRLVWIGNVLSWLPKRAWPIHVLWDVPFERYRTETVNEVVAASRSERADDPRLAELFEAMVGRRLSVLASKTPQTLRVAVWTRKGRVPSVVAHLVNYDAPAVGLPEGRVTPVRDVQVSLPLPGGMKVSRVVQADPWEPDPEPLEFRQHGGRLKFTVPRVDTYRVVWIG